jgi:hypothetical protein
MNACSAPRIRRATTITVVIASIPLLCAIGLAFWSVLDSGSQYSGAEATGAGIMILGLFVAPLYVAVAFPLRARRLAGRGNFSGHAFRKGQTQLLFVTCFLLSLIAIALMGGFSTDGLITTLSVAVSMFLVSAPVCFAMAFVWLRLAK